MWIVFVVSYFTSLITQQKLYKKDHKFWKIPNIIRSNVQSLIEIAFNKVRRDIVTQVKTIALGIYV